MSKLFIQFSHLFISFGSSPLFEDISLSINDGDIFALIGENGAGKTTLLQLLARKKYADSGDFSCASHVSIGYLPQEVIMEDMSLSVRNFIEDNTFSDLEKEMAACLEDSTRLEKWAELHETYERMGGYCRLPIEQVLSGLKIESGLLDLPLSCLSSGQRVRMSLAKILIANPDVLLLDEPTNHLDQEMIQWLEVIVKTRKGACVIVSHDRKFLNSVCNQLIEIKNSTLTCYGGNYDFYLEERKLLLERQVKAYEAQKEEKKSIQQKIMAITFSTGKPSSATDRNIMAYDRRGGRHQKSLQHKLDVLKDHLEAIESNLLQHPKPRAIQGFRFTEISLLSSVAIELRGVRKAYKDKVLFSGLCRHICKGEKILITGPNGCGKTTLLKIMAGIIPVDEGSIYRAPTAKISFLDQEVELLPMDKTPLQYFESTFHMQEEEIRSELCKAALGGVDMLKRPFSMLSVGQRKRMKLLALILEKPNVLFLDEPTNHIDFMTLEALEKALCEFTGVIVAVSHDQTFIEKLATVEWRL